METEVLVAILSLIGTGVGTFAGILTSNKLVEFRLKSLETKVEQHNHVLTRVYKLEARVDNVEKEVNSSDSGRERPR